MMQSLKTDGNRIVTRETNQPVRLRGVNRSGLEYAWAGAEGYLASVGMSEAEVQTLTGEWGANIIRLPFTQQLALEDPAYLDAMDTFIRWATAHGVYTLLDLQWLRQSDNFGTASNGSVIRIAPLPDMDSPRLWRMLGERYRNEPGVLYDLYNEPHDVSAADWNYWATLLTDTLREVHPDSLIFISGLDWGYDLRGVKVDAANIVYSTHVYAGKTPAWKKAFAKRAKTEPVFAGEWGGTDEQVYWGMELAHLFDQLGMGWTAWSWSDWPHLQQNGQPTPFGSLVRAHLTSAETS